MKWARNFFFPEPRVNSAAWLAIAAAVITLVLVVPQ